MAPLAVVTPRGRTLTVQVVADALAAADGLADFWWVARWLGATEAQAEALEREWLAGRAA